MIVCADCGRVREHEARRRCRACYHRHRRRELAAAHVPVIAQRVGDYAWLCAQGETRDAACARLGISRRTAWRYEARLRAGWVPPGWEEWPAAAQAWAARLAARAP